MTVWVSGLAVPMPPPGPCDASAALLHSTAAAIEVTAGAARDMGARVRNDVMEISLQKALSKIRRQSTPGLPRGKILKPRRVLLAFIFVAHSFSAHSSRWHQIACSVAASDSAQTWTPDPRRAFMQFTKVLGLAAVGALLALAAPAERANAMSLSNPGAAAAVQEDARLATTEVHWRHHHHHRWHRWHHRHHHRHWHRW
jgi:hypothetical protein